MHTPARMPNWATLVTNQAVKSGLASDPSVWSKPLADGDWLGVPAGITVTWDLTDCPRLKGLYVAGVFDAGSADAAKVLNVGTVFVDMGGEWLAGDCMTETPLAGTLAVKFLDLPLGPVVDPGQFSVGFITMAALVNMCGAAGKTAFTRLAGVHSGDTVINCVDPIEGWDVGDELLFPGVQFKPVQDEVLSIKAVSGNTVTLNAPLVFDHVPAEGQFCHVGNLTRKIKFSSEAPTGTRGHCMFMPDFANGMATMVNVCHVEVRDCGRTDAMRHVTDPMVDENGVLVPGTADNVRARYAWHEHRQGQAHPATTWEGIVVRGFKKWAFDNHDSNVNASELIAYEGDGSGLATERGTELGSYDHCLLVRTKGSGELPEIRDADEDFGHSGHGIWLQGPGVVVTNCVSSGHAHSGMYVWLGARQSVSAPLGVVSKTFPLNYVPHTLSVGNSLGQTEVPISSVPMFGIQDNIAYGCQIGLEADWGEIIEGHSKSSYVRPVAWNCPVGSLLNHTHNIILDHPVAIAQGYAAGSVGLNSNTAYSGGLEYISPTVKGFEIGVQLGGNSMVVSDGDFCNVVDFDWQIPTDFNFTEANATYRLIGSPQFASPTPAEIGSRTKYRYRLSRPYNLKYQDINQFFVPRYIFLPDGSELFFAEQSPNYVPFPAGGPYTNGFPAELIGKTNQQLHDAYGLAAVGNLGPAMSASDPSVPTNGIIGAPLTPGHYWYARNYGSNTVSYVLTYDYAGDASQKYQVTESTPVTLHARWNVMTRMIDGKLTGFLILCTASDAGNPPDNPPPPSPPPVTLEQLLIQAVPSLTPMQAQQLHAVIKANLDKI